MGKLREINVKAQFTFSPYSTLLATATAAGSLTDDMSGEAKIEIYDPQLDKVDGDIFTLAPVGSVATKDRCISIAWGGIVVEGSSGIIAAAMDGGVIDLWDAASITRNSSEQDALLRHTTAHTGSVTCLDFSTVQPNLLASAGTKGEFFVWDTSNMSAAPTAYKSTRLDEIISVAWNKKVGHIIALGGKAGALSVWDLRKKSELIHIPTRFSISAIAWHPSEPTILSTASGDDHNPIIQVWDLRNANTAKASLVGHEKAVLSLAWCSQDPDLLLSSGSDNRTLLWNPSKAQIAAELPASSQWVHKVSWSMKQPQVMANASLDGKISLFTLQDTKSSITEAVVDETPAGDDFFDSIPKNFQAQSSSFTLKQTPKWLKRPIGARFGFGGKLVQFKLKSTTIELASHGISSTVMSAVEELENLLSSQTIAELCDVAQKSSQGSELQDWEVIKTLTSEHARNALLEYLGFTKEQVETEVVEKFEALSVENKESDAPEDSETTGKALPDQTQEVEEPSVFGNDTDVDFLGIINSVPAGDSNDAHLQDSEHDKGLDDTSPLSIFQKDSSVPDQSITKAILTGQFDSAIDICLQHDRLSDAFMLALCGGVEAQQRVQKAYFKKTTVPYGRLLAFIISGDLETIVKRADLVYWKETLAILCNYAKPADFPDLCEILGKRLETQGDGQKDAILCYLAGSKLEHLVRLWSHAQEQEERASLQAGQSTSLFDIHTTGLIKLIKKVTVFRQAVTFVDAQSKTGQEYPLAILYKKYLELAKIISAEGGTASALEYIALVPADFGDATAMKERLLVPDNSRKSIQSQTSVRTSGKPNGYNQPVVDNVMQAAARPVSSYSSSVQAVPSEATIKQTQPTRSAAVYNPYAPPAVSQQQVQQSVPSLQNSMSPHTSAYQQFGSQGAPGSSQQQASAYNSFAPPPRISSSGPTILPAAQRKDITPWNDAPDIPLPASRRATPAVNRQAVMSPFQPAPTPTLQSFHSTQAQALSAPPPKSRSPAPQRPIPVGAPSVVSQPVQPLHSSARAVMNPYAPPPQASNPSLSKPGLPVGTPGLSTTGPTPYGGYHTSAPQVNVSTRPPPVAPPGGAAASSALFAPPPKTSNVSSTMSGAKGGVGLSKNTVVDRPVNLSPEPSRAGTPVENKPALSVAKYPSGDRSHIPESDRLIEQDLLNLQSHLQAISPDKYRRPLEDTLRRLNVLLDQVNNTQLTDGTREQLRILSVSLRNQDWARAYNIHKELTNDKMHECRDWIAGIKALIVLGKKSAEEGWTR